MSSSQELTYISLRPFIVVERYEELQQELEGTYIAPRKIEGDLGPVLAYQSVFVVMFILLSREVREDGLEELGDMQNSV